MIGYLADQDNFLFSISEVLICAYGTHILSHSFSIAVFCNTVFFKNLSLF